MKNILLKSIFLFCVALACCNIGQISSASLFSHENKPEGRLEELKQIERPEKPLIFKTKQDLLNYIKKVNEYYAIAGRPRFGKRGYGFSEELNSHERDYNSNQLYSNRQELYEELSRILNDE